MKVVSSILTLLILGVRVDGQPIEKRVADSLLHILDKTKPGVERIDLLLNLAQYHILKPGERQIDFDSAILYINEAAILNKSAKSSTAYGYQLLTESHLTKEKGNKNEAKKMVEKAIPVLESGNNKTYLGKAYYELSTYYDYNDAQQLSKKITLVEQSVDAFRLAGNLERKASSLTMLGDLYVMRDELPKSIQVLKEALATYDSIKYQSLQGVYILLGEAYMYKGDLSQSLFYMLKSLRTAKILQDTSMQLCQINNLLGNLYLHIDRKEMSVKYLTDALEVAKKHQDEYSIFLLATNISTTYNNLERAGEALKVLGYIPKSYIVSDYSLDKAAIGMAYLRTYTTLKEYSKARPYCDTILRLADNKIVGDVTRNSIYRLAANYYIHTRQFSKARYYLDKNFEINKIISHEIGIIQDSRLWYKVDSAEGNFQSAFNHLHIYKTKMDSLSGENRVKQLQVLGVEYETAMKEDSIKQKDQHISLLMQRSKLQQTNLQQANLIKNITIGGIVLVSIILILLYYQFKNNQKNNKIILQNNKIILEKNKQLEDMLAEKEWWLKEVHHRVKNNLHTIICLLESQAMYLEKDALQAIEKSQHRIYAMSLIHQKLYQNEDLQVIDMSVYLEEFIGYLKDSFETDNIEFIIKVEPVQLNLQQAIPVALIINESVTNAIKYAFGNEEGSKIWITMNETDTTVKLTIADNGRGFELSEENERKSLGMQLIRGLSKELKGTVLIESKQGTKLSIVFEQGPLTDKIPSLQEDHIG